MHIRTVRRESLAVGGIVRNQAVVGGVGERNEEERGRVRLTARVGATRNQQMAARWRPAHPRPAIEGDRVHAAQVASIAPHHIDRPLVYVLTIAHKCNPLPIRGELRVLVAHTVVGEARGRAAVSAHGVNLAVPPLARCPHREIIGEVRLFAHGDTRGGEGQVGGLFHRFLPLRGAVGYGERAEGYKPEGEE